MRVDAARVVPEARLESSPETPTRPAHGTIHVLRLVPHFYRAGVWPVAFDPVGGMQNQVWQLCESLDDASIVQTIATSHIPGSQRSYRVFRNATVRSIGFHLPEFLAGWLLNFSWFLALLPFLARNLSKFDMVHLHLDHSVWCRLLALVIKRSRIPLVISLNVSLLSDGEDSVVAPDGMFGLRNWLERRALRIADRVVALSSRQAETMARLAPGKQARVSIIPDVLDAASFGAGIDQAAIDGFRAKHGIPPDRPVVSYIGRISEEKGWRELPPIVDRLIKAGVFVLICGDGPCRRQLARSLARNGGDRHWCITGFVPRDEVKAALGITRVLMLPSRREAFGSILLEAMAWDVPTVAYRVGGIPDVAGHPPAFALVPPRDREQLVLQVSALLTDPDLRRTYIEQGRKRVQSFSIGLARERLLGLYRSLA